MQLRRSIALTAGMLALAVATLASCGFDAATNRPYTPAEGVNSTEGDVKVLAAVVVAAQPDSGTFIASLTNSSTTDEATFEGIAGAAGNTVEVDEFAPVEIPPRGLVNLATDGGPTLSGTFEAGDVLPLTLSLGNGETITIRVPVVPACEEYAGLDESAPAGSNDEPEGAYACGADDEVVEGGH